MHRVVVHQHDGTPVLEWCTDVLPHEFVDMVGDAYTVMFQELLAAVNAHRF